ncbi:hypothetical protein CXB51_001809 [Gossypium anomalum]|uniref:Reverse transcriptase zinc-binding domain-containing protein n=1 Tax=Gossypium anomalum TaxID=47600 RepID=A0A8J6A2L8_9ROSI|nr:hypothetical protein CXB51_001809 [Gossypium anomalum]
MNDLIPDSMMVEDLIERDSRQWNKGLIHNTFSEIDAERILRIPLVRVVHEDFQVWKGEVSGDYSVRSAYKLLLQQSMDPNLLLEHTTYRHFYKKIWGLQLPTKLKITFWRCSKNYIPTLCNLYYKQLSNETVCSKRADLTDFKACF